MARIDDIKKALTELIRGQITGNDRDRETAIAAYGVQKEILDGEAAKLETIRSSVDEATETGNKLLEMLKSIEVTFPDLPAQAEAATAEVRK